jgi:hypothetical protein
MGSIITSLGAGIVYPNQVTLPAVNADRAGEVFIHQGQAWRFTDGTEGWDLPVGTPWPVKGYKTIILSGVVSGLDESSISVSDFENVTVSVVSLEVRVLLGAGLNEDSATFSYMPNDTPDIIGLSAISGYQSNSGFFTFYISDQNEAPVDVLGRFACHIYPKTPPLINLTPCQTSTQRFNPI